MRYTKIPEATFQNLQLNAGVMLKKFTPTSGAFEDADIIGATSGGVNFVAEPTFTDFGEDIDNCPANMKELKRLDTWTVTLSGSLVSISPTSAELLVGLADLATDKITPRNDIDEADFADIWWVGDYSDKNGDTNGGFVACHLINALSTGGLNIQSNDNGKGTFSFTFTGHYSLDAQDTPPFEVYVHTGTAEG